jgi:hypothetical protein
MDEDSPFKYVEPDFVANLVRSGATASDSASIIDVRDDDFSDGHIPTATNVPSAQWIDDAVIESVFESNRNAKILVFHCMYSKFRGPTCAIKFAEFLDEREIPYSQRPQM